MRQVESDDFDGGRLMALDFSSFIEMGDSVTVECPVSSIVGKKVDAGRLFAYCFRRFGYPQRAWDGYKDLAVYLLTTGRTDLVMAVRPNVSCEPNLNFQFLVPFAVYQAVRTYDRREQRAWLARAYAWVDTQALPDWMPQWIAAFNDRYAGGHPNGIASSWRSTVDVAFLSFGAEGSAERELSTKFANFYKSAIEAYAVQEPCPLAPRRGRDCSTWAEDDPLKPLALAAQAAISELRKPVEIRDYEIAGWGEVDGRHKVYESAPSAGYPCGAIGNRDPQSYAQLHGLIHQLGNGDPTVGLTKALELLQSQTHANTNNT